MRQSLDKMKKIVIALCVVQGLLITLLYFALHLPVMVATLMLVIEIIAFYLIFDYFEDLYERQSSGVRSILGTSAEEAYLKGGLGIVIYNDNYEVTWMSELFKKRGIERNGHRILTWIPEANDLIAGTSDIAVATLDERIYEISRKQDAPVLFFHDVTELSTYKKRYNNEKLVLGMASFDNFDETIQYEDDAEAAGISATLRATLGEYCSSFGVLAKRLSSSRYLLILNEETYAKLAADKFSILSKIRKTASKMDVTITLSLAFARGEETYDELDDMVNNLMDLAETRGGDQVAVQKAGEDVVYFGGSSEATEKRSRVRVRVMAHAFRDLLMKSSNVIICGHKVADFDCIGSAICLAKMAAALKKPVCIIAKTGGIEEKLRDAMKLNEEELKSLHFVTEGEALNQLTDNSLVMMTDHHNIKQSNGAKVLEAAKKIVVIDHHRRSTDMGVKPVLVYIEAGASSTCELLTEMLPYVSNRTDITELEATFMLTGMIVDTQHFKVRTTSRTYDAARALRELGADPSIAFKYLKDTYDEFALKSAVTSSAERYEHGIVIASVADKNMTRSLMSQVADSLLNVQGVRSAFVISKGQDGEIGISSRSDGSINVQMIMEKMGGGGHMTAAAMQRNKGTIDSIKEELLAAIARYFEEEEEDESNS